MKKEDRVDHPVKLDRGTSIILLKHRDDTLKLF